MNKKNILLMLAIIVTNSIFAQWFLSGNSGTDPSINFLGTTDAEDLVFRTNNTPWLRLNTIGWFGLNTTSPAGRLHINDGCILGTGLTGTNPNLGAGTRLMWIPSAQAFRAGIVTGTEWDSGSVGDFSAAFGSDNIASGDGSFGAGLENEASGQQSTSFGFSNISSGNFTLTAGSNNVASANSAVALGLDNSATNEGAVALGDGNLASGHDALAAIEFSTASGARSLAMGFNCVASGSNSIALGYFSEATSFFSYAQGENAISEASNGNAIGQNVTVSSTGATSTTIGCNNIIQTGRSMGLGEDISLNDAFDSENLNFAFGHFLISDDVSNTYMFGSHISNSADGTVSIGRGFNTVNPLENSIPHSMMFSTGSNLPTLFISPSNSFNGVGNVGIGNLTSPSQRLDVNGTARFRVMPNETPDAIIVGKEQLADGDYTLNYLAFNGQSDMYLAGNGSWQTLAVDPICEWNEGVDPDDLVMGFSTACHEGNVGIGLDNPFAKLELFKDGTGLAQHVIAQQIDLIGTNNGATNESCGLDIDVTGDNEEPDYAHTGVKIDVEYSRKIRGADIATTAGLDTGENFGVKSVAAGQSTVTNCLNVGVWGEAKNAPSGGRDIGVCGVATDGANANIGIHGKVSSGQTSYAGYFEGNVHIVGNLTATGSGTFNTSDATLKSDISDLENGLEVIMQLSPKTYQYTVDQYPQLSLPTGQHAGVLAQDLEIFLPELVKEVTMLGQTSENGDLLNENVSFKAVNYTELIPYLIGAIKQQQNQIESLQISLDACCSSDTKSQATGEGEIRSIKLESSPSPILYQNTPNPHQGQTVIRYFLPENSGAAEMHFFDTQGQVIRIETIQQTGMGQINVDASDLANGVYTYALLINGKVIDMKKMVKE